MSASAACRTDRPIDICDEVHQIMVDRSFQIALRLARDIVEIKHANEYALKVDDRETTESLRAQQLYCAIQIVLAATGDNASCHRAVYGKFGQRPTLRISCHADITVGQKPDGPMIAVDHRHGTAGIFPHDLRRYVQRIFGMAGSNLVSH